MSTAPAPVPTGVGTSRARLALLAATAMTATTVVGYFLVTQPEVGLKTPGRAAGWQTTSVAVLGVVAVGVAVSARAD